MQPKNLDTIVHDSIRQPRLWIASHLKRLPYIGFGLGLVIVLLLLSSISVIGYYRYTSNHLPPNITINEIAVGNLTYEAAQEKLEQS